MRERELEDVMHQFVERRGRRARLDDDRRVGARRAEREHDVRESRRPLRPRAAVPAPRPRRALAPPRVLLPARARRRSTRTPSAGCRCSSITPSSARAIGSRSRTWRCAAPGNLLGPEQSGFVQAVGLRPVPAHARRDGRSVSCAATAHRSSCPPTSRWTCPAYLPDDYVAVAGGEARRLPAPHARDRRRQRSTRCATSCATGSDRCRRTAKRCFAVAHTADRRGVISGSRASWCAATRPVLPFATLRYPV